jgi:hypothetical protein
MGQSQDPSRNEDQSVVVVSGEKLKVKCECEVKSTRRGRRGVEVYLCWRARQTDGI